MELISYLKLYLTERDVSEAYGLDLGYTIKALDDWAKHPLHARELADDLVNRWLISLGERMKPRSVKHHRANLLAIWRAAADAGYTDSWPRRVRRIKVPRTLPLAWHLEEVRRLLAAADEIKGCFRGTTIKRSAFFRAYIYVAWNSGLRPSDLWLLQFDEIGSDGTLIHIANKTGEVIMRDLEPEAVAAIEQISEPKRERIFGDVITLEAIRRQFTALVKSVGLTGSPKKIRKSASTAVEAQKEGAATKFLGHRTIEMAMRHYVDPRHLERDRTLPPPLHIISQSNGKLPPPLAS